MGSGVAEQWGSGNLPAQVAAWKEKDAKISCVLTVTYMIITALINNLPSPHASKLGLARHMTRSSGVR